MDVGVVAVDRVDVVAQPDARVGELHRAGRAGSASVARERARLGRREALLEPEEAGRLGLQARVDPARGEPVVVVARESTSSPSGPSAAPSAAKNGAGELERVAVRRPRAARAPSPRITSRSTPLERLEQRLAQLGPAQQVVALGRAEVQVGDDERPHRD